jgi:hypothetical protein
MENLKKYLPKAIFCSFGLKLLLLNPDWATVGGFCVSGLVFLVTEHLNNQKTIHLFEKKIEEQQKQLIVFEDRLDKFSDSLGSLQVTRGFKPMISK